MSACTHYWTTTSECPNCLRAEVNRAHELVRRLISAADFAREAASESNPHRLRSQSWIDWESAQMEQWQQFHSTMREARALLDVPRGTLTE